MSDENVNETVKSIEQNAKWMTLKTLYYYENMLLISLCIIIILRFRDLSIEQLNKQIMTNILQGRTLLRQFLKFTKKVQIKAFYNI